jgi:protein-disulfide isomerase
VRRPGTAATLAAALLALPACGGGTPASPAETAVLRVPVGTSPVRGPSEAWVTVVEFTDFECPYCASVQPTLDTVLAEFGADVRLVYKHFPLSIHAHALPVAVATECAHGQGRFWELHDLVFAGRDALFSAADFETALGDLASRAGLDLVAWQSCRSSLAANGTVVADIDLGRRWGIPGTPAFVVNGTLVVGNQPAATFRAAIAKARDEARASGVPADRYYDTVVLGP